VIRIIRTNSDNTDFMNLVKELDAYLAVTDGEEHSFYSQYNTLDTIKYAVVVYEGSTPIGCGAIKEYSVKAVEVKRMYAVPSHRKKGIATLVLTELEKWAVELFYEKCILETGKRQYEAVKFYMKNNYTLISNYGQYMGVANSLCFEKIIS